MTIIDIGDPQCLLPDKLLLDASLLLHLRPTTIPTSQQVIARRFLARISAEAGTGNLLCLASVLTLEECYFKMIQASFMDELPHHEASLKIKLGRTRVMWHDLYKDMPSLIQKYMPTIQAFRTLVQAIPVLAIEPEDLVDNGSKSSLEERMVFYLGNVPILPKDAYLIAIAERLNIPHLATLDRDFKNVSWLNIYTVP
jgi:hypothetical protein